MIVMKSVLGPSGYRVGVGFQLRFGEFERVEHLGSGFVAGVFTGSGIIASIQANASCQLIPIITSVSGNTVGIETFTMSGLNAASSVLLATPFTVVAQGY